MHKAITFEEQAVPLVLHIQHASRPVLIDPFLKLLDPSTQTHKMATVVESLWGKKFVVIPQVPKRH